MLIIKGCANLMKKQKLIKDNDHDMIANIGLNTNNIHSVLRCQYSLCCTCFCYTTYLHQNAVTKRHTIRRKTPVSKQK